MLFPQAMTELELIVPARDLLAVTKVISNEGVFQQADSNTLGIDADSKVGKKDTTWQERASAYAQLERRIQSIMQTLNIEESDPPAAEFDTMVEINIVRPVVEQIEREVKKVTDALASDHKHLEQLESTLIQLEPVAELNLDISLLRNPRYLFSELGTMPNENIQRLQTSIARVPHVFLILRQDAQKAVVWLAGTQKNADILSRAARSAYINAVSLPEDYHGTPAQMIATIRGNMQQTQQHIRELEQELNRLCETHKGQLQTMLWNVSASRLLADAIVRFGRLQYTYLIVGWVLASHLEDLTLRIKQVSKETLIEAFPLKRGEVHENVPVSLKNPGFMRPFQTLVTTYARPTYNEVDPTLLIAITFPLLFGAMFGDLGQGLVLAGLGWLLSSRKVKALNSMAGLGGLITFCGLSAAVFGILYGSVFGFEDIIPALWMRPLNNIMTLLIIAIGAGVVLLVAGFLIGMFNAFVSRDWGRLFFDRNGVAGFILYISLLLIVLGVFLKRTFLPMPVLIVLIVISGVAVMFSEVFKRLIEGHRPLVTEGLGTYGIQAFFELFEAVIGFLSNSLSYVRVGAFAVAHAGLSQVIFILAGLVGPVGGVGYWIVVLLGNIFIIGFEGLIVGIQTMRLEYYEFFSKFFKGGGSTYQPLTLRPVEE
jgi:V/A-type H+/Na+-transporting ATPase subunit I